MAIGGAAPHDSPGELPDFERPLLHAHGGLQPGKDPAEAHDHEAQCSPAAGGATSLRTCFNGLNALSGVGLLSIPYALAEGGWLSLVLLLLVAMVCCYTGQLLQTCMGASPDVRGYPDIGALAFGAKGRFAVSAFMYAELYLVAIGFLILEGDNLDKLFPGTSLSLGGVLVLSGKHLFIVLVSIVILPTTWLRNLGVLAYVSASGVLASVVLVFCVLWAAVVDGVGFQGKGTMLNVSGLPTALGLYTFCYCGHAIFPTLCNSMKEKDKFSKVLVICFVACTLNYGSMAILGYLMYGDDVESQVTLNLPEGKLSSKLAIYTALINPFSKYALMVTCSRPLLFPRRRHPPMPAPAIRPSIGWSRHLHLLSHHERRQKQGRAVLEEAQGGLRRLQGGSTPPSDEAVSSIPDPVASVSRRGPRRLGEGTEGGCRYQIDMRSPHTNLRVPEDLFFATKRIP